MPKFNAQQKKRLILGKLNVYQVNPYVAKTKKNALYIRKYCFNFTIFEICNKIIFVTAKSTENLRKFHGILLFSSKYIPYPGSV